MRTVHCQELTGVDGLRLVEAELPPLEPGGLLIDVHAAGVNFADTLIIKGQYQEKPDVPFAPGLEIAGVVRETAIYVNNASPGDRVLALLDHGGYAEVASAHEDGVIRIPDKMDFATAATFPVVYLTSHLALQHRAPPANAAKCCSSTALPGGVGLTAVEVGKALGATVHRLCQLARKTRGRTRARRRPPDQLRRRRHPRPRPRTDRGRGCRLRPGRRRCLPRLPALHQSRRSHPRNRLRQRRCATDPCEPSTRQRRCGDRSQPRPGPQAPAAVDQAVAG